MVAREATTVLHTHPSARLCNRDLTPQWHWIVREEHEERLAEPARWGLINAWAKDRKRAAQQINARAESLDSRPAYRSAFKSRRCVIPADGFYEWRGPKGHREPLWFHRPDGGLILFAGLVRDMEFHRR